MNAIETIETHPKEDWEKPHDYFIRISDISGYTYSSIKTAFYRMSKEDRQIQGLTLSKVVEHPGGTETSVYTRKTDEVDTSGLVVDRVTTSPNGGQWVKYKASESLTEQDIENVMAKVIENHPIETALIEVKRPANKKQLNVIITDDHIGIDTNPEKIGLFAYKYDKETYYSKIDEVLSSIKKEVDHNGTFDELVINNLGDLEDGWNGYTTRGGHQLPQNLTNEETFEVAITSRMKMIQALVDMKAANKIIMRVVTNSNHSASFALIVGKAIKLLCKGLYSETFVFIDVLRKFIEHRRYGKHCFLLTHGKDKKEMRSGLPLVLNDKSINYVRSYLDFHKIKDDNVHVWKGDAHRFASTSTKTFDYTSFRTFSPVSNWIGTNFGDIHHPGYSIIIVSKDTDYVTEQHYKINYDKII